jgi:thioesterase domain-containing protein
VPQWQSLAQGRVVAHDLLGVHLDMMEEPTVAETARLVREHLGDEPASAEVALMTAPVASGQQ